jgi:hypothetical protein
MGVESTMTYGAIAITFADGSNSISSDSTAINVLSNSGKMIAAYASPIPGATIAVAPAAAVLTVIKIASDDAISPGDILSVVGNVVGVIGAVGVLAGTSGVVIPAAAIGLALGALGALGNTPFGQSTLGSVVGWLSNARRFQVRTATLGSLN